MKGDKQMKIKVLLVALVLCIVSAWLASPVVAADNMTFHGTLMETPPCEINNGQPIEISFDEVGVNKIDGKNYAQTFKMMYQCSGNDQDVVVRYVGDVTAFDNAAVKSNITDFGINLRSPSVNGVLTDFNVGTTLPVSADQTSLTFVATPVKRKGADLPGEHFISSAMLQLEYP